ncbi:MAG: hypothetical protein AB7J35_11550 [Dehalococcoidia bacterium]
MTTATLSTRAPSARPATLNAAIVLTIINAIGSIAFLPLAPDDIPGIAIVLTIAFTVVVLFGAWGMWNSWKWAAILVFVVTAINGLLSIPGIFAGPNLAVKISCAIGVPIFVATCVLIAKKQTRDALH